MTLQLFITLKTYSFTYLNWDSGRRRHSHAESQCASIQQGDEWAHAPPRSRYRCLTRNTSNTHSGAPKELFPKCDVIIEVLGELNASILFSQYYRRVCSQKRMHITRTFPYEKFSILIHFNVWRRKNQGRLTERHVRQTTETTISSIYTTFLWGVLAFHILRF